MGKKLIKTKYPFNRKDSDQTLAKLIKRLLAPHNIDQRCVIPKKFLNAPALYNNLDSGTLIVVNATIVLKVATVQL